MSACVMESCDRCVSRITALCYILHVFQFFIHIIFVAITEISYLSAYIFVDSMCLDNKWIIQSVRELVLSNHHYFSP